jgi:hypothetical protein
VEVPFDVTSQNDSDTHFTGTFNKVGRTTGWTSGTATTASTCATVNVRGSNIQLLCQTLVTNSSATIVGSGDSGSPVFTVSGGNVELVGILWGGSGSSTFVFSPLSGLIEDGLGPFDATADGSPTEPPAEETGSITGTVTDADGGAGIGAATVSVDGTTLSAITDGSGAYTIADVPPGDYGVTASADGYVPGTASGVSVTANTSEQVDFALAAEPGDPAGGTVSVNAISYSTNGGRNGDRHLNVTVALLNDGGVPVANASVSIDLVHNGTVYGSAAGTTGSDGTVSFGFNNSPSGEYTTVVTEVVANGLEWDGQTPGNSHTK